MGAKQTFVTGIFDVNTANLDGLGTIRYENAGVWKYVQFQGATAVVAGTVVSYNNTLLPDATGVDPAAGAGAAPAGVAAATVPTGVTSYGWIQIRGQATLASALGGAPAYGNALTSVGAPAGQLTLMTAVTQEACAWAYDVTNRKVICNFMF